MNRRNLLQLFTGVAGAAGVSPVFSKEREVPVDVAKVMSFTCNFCLDSESQDGAIEKAVRKRGGKFVRAPIAATAGNPGYRERVYYAARDMNPAFGEQIKMSLYRGTQEAKVTLEAYAQVYYWLLQDIPDEEAKLIELIERAQQPSAEAALTRAVNLTISSGVEKLPTYVLLSRGRVLTTMDTSTTGATSMAGLREAVLNKLRTI